MYLMVFRRGDNCYKLARIFVYRNLDVMQMHYV